MKRNIIFFLDLVTQVLAIMIIMTSLAARHGAGVGQVKPDANYLMVEAIYPKELAPENLVEITDGDAVSVLCVPQGNTTTVLFSARRYFGAANEKPFAIKVRADLLAEPASEIYFSRPKSPDQIEKNQNCTLKQLNDDPRVNQFFNFTD